MTALLIIILALSTSTPDLQGPAPAPPEQRSSEQKQPTSDAHGAGPDSRTAQMASTSAEPVVVVIEKAPSDEGKPTKDSNENDGEPYCEFAFKVATVVLTLALVLIAGIQAYGLFYQVRVSRHLLETNERPWLIVHVGDEPEDGIDTPIADPSLFMVHFIVVNSGRGLAWVEVESFGCSFRLADDGGPIEEPFEMEPLRLSPAPFAPGEKRSVQEVVALDSDQRTAILERKAMLILHGRVLYRDGFGKRHETAFRFQGGKAAQFTEWSEEGGWWRKPAEWDEAVWWDLPDPSGFRYT